jgi:hypothetical protein
MLRRRGIRVAVVLLLALALGAPAGTVWAAGGPPRLAVLNPLAALWSWAQSWLAAVRSSGVPPAITTTCDRGSMIDPNGRCITAPVTTACDHGSMIDPNGGCVSAAVPPAGH